MRRKVILPFVEEPLLTSYHSNAFPIGIVQSNFKQDLTPWLCCRYINCHYMDFASGNKFDICTSDNWFTDERILLHQALDLQWENYSLLGIDILRVIKKMIAARYYVRGLYDEMYIPGKTAYQKQSYVHDFLLIGFNDLKGVFVSVGYTDKQKFERYEIPYDCFYQSIACRVGRQTTLDFYKFNPDARIVFNMMRVYRGLNDYLKSKSYERWIWKKGRVFGLAAVEQLKKLFERTYNQEQYIDIRYTRLLVEHKFLMAERMKYLYTEKYIETDFAVKASRNVYENAKRVHLLGIKANMTENEKNVERLLTIIQEMIDEEKAYLSVIVNLTHNIVTDYWNTHAVDRRKKQ